MSQDQVLSGSPAFGFAPPLMMCLVHFTYAKIPLTLSYGCEGF